MNNQNFYLRLIALLLIIMAVFFYNGTMKDKEQEQNIADLTAKVESLEDQQTEILTALQENYEEQKNAAESKKSSESDEKKSDSKKTSTKKTPKKIPPKILLILTMFTKTALSKDPVQDTAELSLCR